MFAAEAGGVWIVAAAIVAAVAAARSTRSMAVDGELRRVRRRPTRLTSRWTSSCLDMLRGECGLDEDEG